MTLSRCGAAHGSPLITVQCPVSAAPNNNNSLGVAAARGSAHRRRRLLTAPAMAHTFHLSMAILLHLCAAFAPPKPAGPTFSVGPLTITLDSQTQHIASLTTPAVDLPTGRFDLMPNATTFHGSHHLGDVTLRVRVAGSNDSFTTLTTGGSLAGKAAPLPTPPGELAAANLTATLATPPALTLRLERHYRSADDGHGVEMRFELTNGGEAAVEVGAWGAAMVFDTMQTSGGGHRTLDGFAGNCSMVDPAISGEGGWVSATRSTPIAILSNPRLG